MTIRKPSAGTLTMRGTTSFAALALATALAAILQAAPAAAQPDILVQGRAGSPAGDRFRVDSAGGVVALGGVGRGVIPATGTGYRMMWHPFKAAFRAGYADGNLWDDISVAYYSWAGGYGTMAPGNYSFVLGNGAIAYGTSAIALGELVQANGNYSVALGHRASAGTYGGTFSWADASTTDFSSNTASNSFQIRADGGVRMLTNSAANVGASLSSGGSSWNIVSDRDRKRDFAPVEGDDVLARIRNLPVTTWAYIDEAGNVRHMGPMAQDWHAAFGFSADDTTINMSDLDGVTLASVQALERQTAELQAQLVERDARIAEMEAWLARMEALLAEPAEAP
jgi:hypothetical protein